MKQSGRGIWMRLIAVLLAVILVLNAVFIVRTRVQFNSADYSGGSSEYAAVVTEQNTAYLKKGLAARTQTMLNMILRTPETYEEYMAAAEVAIAEEKYSEASSYLTGCIDTFQGDPKELANLYMRLGSVYILLGETEKAITELSMAVKLDSGLSQAYMLRAQMYEELGESGKAADDVRSYAKLEGDDPAILSSLGPVYENAGEYDNAIECYTIGIDNKETYTDHLYVDRGRCYLMSEKYKKAKADLEKYLEVTEKDEKGEAAAMLGMCRMELKDYKGAAEMLKQAIKSGYEDTELLWKQVIVCSYAAGDYATAVSDGKEAIKSKDSAELEYWVGMSLFAQKNFSEAATYFEKAANMGEEIEDLTYNRAVCALALEQYEEAEKLFAETIEKKENEPAAYYNRAICYLSMNDLESAKADLQEAADQKKDKTVAEEAKALLAELFPEETKAEQAAGASSDGQAAESADSGAADAANSSESGASSTAESTESGVSSTAESAESGSTGAAEAAKAAESSAVAAAESGAAEAAESGAAGTAAE